MKILLAVPISNSFMLIPDLGLGYLASAVRKAGLEVKILDCAKERISLSEFAKIISREKPDLLGFKVFSKDFYSVKESLQITSQMSPKTIKVVGGPHPSGVPIQTLQELEEADFGFVGEAEIGFTKLCQSIAAKEIKIEKEKQSLDSKELEILKKIPGLIWRCNDEIYYQEQVFPEDLDSLGLPAWDLIDPREYPPAPEGSFAKSFPIAPVIATRGCPYKCTFCSVKNTTGRRLRFRSIEHILEELKLLYYEYGIREIHFEDDNFTLKKSFLVEVCQSIIKNGLKIHWSCPNGVRLDTLDEDVLSLMKESGCYSLAIGIESGSQRILDHMKKELSLEFIKKKIPMIRKIGINVHGFFILGYPYETKADIQKTIQLALELPLNTAYFNLFNPFPGTELYDKLVQENRLKELDWSSLTGENPSIPLADVSLKELKALQRKAMLRFFLRPKPFLEFISRIRSLKQIKFLFIRVLSVLARNSKIKVH